MRKRTIFVTAVPLVAAGAIASAFVSQQLNASSNGSTATAQKVTATLTGVPQNFGPGDKATIRLHVSNPNSYPVHVSGASFKVDPITGCDADSFTVDNVTGATDIPKATSAGPTVTDAVTADLTFNNLPGKDQNGCLGQTIVVSASAS